MTATVEQLESEWRKLIDLAQRGEDVVITNHGQPIAKLSGISKPPQPSDRKEWLARLAQLRERTSTGKTGPTVEQILDEDRGDRGA